MNWRFDALMCDQHDYECILHGLSEIDRRYSCIAQYRIPMENCGYAVT